MPSPTLAPDAVEERCAFPAMGTIVTVRVVGAAPEGVRLAITEVERLEALWSRFRPDSEVSRLVAAAGGWVEVSPETRSLLETALQLTRLTDGAFDITAGSPTGRLEADGSGQFRLLGGARADLGGIAKGAAVERVIQILRGAGATSAVVNFGQSSIGVLGTPRGQDAWRVGIRRPGQAPDRICGALRLTGGFVSTSGDYEETSARGNHILDPRTGRPAASGVRSATVVCADGAWSEALSTALLVLGVDAGLALHRALGGFDAVLIDQAGGVHHTAGLANPNHSTPAELAEPHQSLDSASV